MKITRMDDGAPKPAEAPVTAEYTPTPEAALPIGRGDLPQEDRTFSEPPSNGQVKAKASRWKTTTVVLTAAGLTLSAGILGTTVNLAMQHPSETAEVQLVTEETTDIFTQTGTETEPTGICR